MNENNLWLLDLDRTLIQSAKLNDMHVEAVRAIEGDDLADELLRRQEIVEAAGGSYVLAAHLQESLSDDRIVQIDDYLQRTVDPESIREPGATRLLKALADHAIPHAIFTYGVQERQWFKMKLAQLTHIPVMFTNTSAKSRTLSDLYDQRGFVIPSQIFGEERQFTQVTLVEDKASAFDGKRSEERGIWYRPTDAPLLPAQRGEVSADIIIVPHLDVITTSLDSSRL